MVVNFVNPKKFTSMSGQTINPPSASQTTTYFPYKQASKANEAGVGSSTTTLFIVTVLIQVAAAILSEGSMELMWSMVNTLQIIFYIGLMSLYYPAHVNVFFGYLALANASNPILSYITEIVFGA
jgi:hypothetical protein